MNLFTWMREGLAHWGRTATMALFGLAVLGVLVTLLAHAFGPPTVEEVEQDIWRDWARATVDGQGENIAGLLARSRQAACQQLLDDFGQTTARMGDSFVLRTSVREIEVRDAAGNLFASWNSEETSHSTNVGWSSVLLPLSTGDGPPLGTLRVTYKFNEQTLGGLPNVRRLALLHDRARLLIGDLIVAMLLAVLTNMQWQRERALRVKSQQVTLDLARQLCHELRNGLWAFSLEGNNLRRLFALVDEYLNEEKTALHQAASRVGITPADLDRLRRQIQRFLAEKHLDPETDLSSANAMAKESQQNIESFSRYINLTVEELDRNLLGRALSWQPERVAVIDCWHEACQLLELRLRSAGVQIHEEVRTEENEVVVDRRALVHVFVNLIKNGVEAIRELPGTRTITLTLSRSERSLVCEVHNGGPPIPPALLPHLFEEGTSTKGGDGRGIGLALIRSTIERMEGKIFVRSDDSGTTFTFHLPVPRETSHRDTVLSLDRSGPLSN